MCFRGHSTTEVVATAAPQERVVVKSTEGMVTAVGADAGPQVGAAGAGEGVEEREGGEHMEVTEEKDKTTLEKVTSEMRTLEMEAMKKPEEVPRDRRADKRNKDGSGSRKGSGSRTGSN